MKEKLTIFLGIDGVLNSWGIDRGDKECVDTIDLEGEVFNNFSKYAKDLYKSLYKENVENFNRLIDKLSINYEIDIIVSSLWRQFLNFEELKEILDISGVHGTVLGTLKVYPLNSTGDKFEHPAFDKEELISSWIKENSIDKYLILDDDSFGFFEEGLGENFYKTNVNYGLTKRDITNIIIELKDKRVI